MCACSYVTDSELEKKKMLTMKDEKKKKKRGKVCKQTSFSPILISKTNSHS